MLAKDLLTCRWQLLCTQDLLHITSSHYISKAHYVLSVAEDLLCATDSYHVPKTFCAMDNYHAPKTCGVESIIIKYKDLLCTNDSCHVLKTYCVRLFFDSGASSGWPYTCYVAQDDLKFLILLFLLPEYQACRHVPSNPLYAVLGIKSRALCMPGKCSTTEPHNPSPIGYLICITLNSRYSSFYFVVQETEV